MHNIPIVYEDDALLIVNKPSGLLSVPTPKSESRTLTSILNNDAKERGSSSRLYPCHRLDRETSGPLIFAKGKSIQKKMFDEFLHRRVKKTYIAFVHGAPVRSSGEINSRIDGLSATTHYKVIERRKDFTIIQARPLTGRTNQLRIHFKALGHPIVGETKFAFRRDFKLRAKRLCLHAQSLEFPHPVTGKDLRVDIELAEDLKQFLDRQQ